MIEGKTLTTAVFLLLLVATGCSTPAPSADSGVHAGQTWHGSSHDGPVVLLTLGGLRADIVSPQLTPHLAALAAEADWSGSAVASAAWAPPSLATLTTGLDPWLHQVLADRSPPRGARARGFPTLGEAFAERGYAVNTYLSGSYLRGSPLAPRALGQVRPLRRGAFAEGHLESLGEEGRERQLLWVQMEEPALPYERRGGLRRRLADLSDPFVAALPRRLLATDLERWDATPGSLSAPRRAVLDALYRFEVAEADRQLGRYLAALRASQAWDDTLLVVTALHGASLGIEADAGPSQSLSRGLLEVPLVIKLPDAWSSGRSADRSGDGSGDRRTLAAPSDRLVPLARVWSTLVAAVGAPVPPAAPLSLFHEMPTAALSEALGVDGENQLSRVEATAGTAGEVETWQLLWRGPVSPAEGGSAGQSDSAAGSDPELTLLRWLPGGGTVVVDDAERTAAMALRLRRQWLAFQACEPFPAAEWAQDR